MEKIHSFVQLLADQHPYLLIAIALLLGLALGVMLGILLGYRVMLRPVQRRYQGELGVANEEIIRTKTEFSEYKRRVRRKLEREIARIRAQEVAINAKSSMGEVVSGGESASPEYEQRVQDYFQTTAKLFSEMQEAQQAMFEQMQRVNHRYSQVIDHVNLGAATLTGRLPAPTHEEKLPDTRRPRRRTRDGMAPRPAREPRIQTKPIGSRPPEESRGVVSDFMADLQRADRQTVEHDPEANASTRRPRQTPGAATAQKADDAQRSRRPRRGSLS